MKARIASKKQHSSSIGAQQWRCFFLSRPKSDFGAGADRKLDFQGDRIREGFTDNHDLRCMIRPKAENKIVAQNATDFSALFVGPSEIWNQKRGACRFLKKLEKGHAGLPFPAVLVKCQPVRPSGLTAKKARHMTSLLRFLGSLRLYGYSHTPELIFPGYLNALQDFSCFISVVLIRSRRC